MAYNCAKRLKSKEVYEEGFDVLHCIKTNTEPVRISLANNTSAVSAISRTGCVLPGRTKCAR